MKSKKIILAMIFVILICLITLQPLSSAVDTKILTVARLREGIGGTTRYAYQLTDKDILKIYEVPNNFSQAIYCLAAGVGDFWPGVQITYRFSETLKGSGETVVQSNASGLREELSVNLGYKTQLRLGATNGSLLWLLDNLYLPKHTPETERQEFRNKLLSEVFKADLEADYTIPFTLDQLSITDDDIEVVQQWAIWQFTTANNLNSSYTTEELPAIQLATGTSDSDLSAFDNSPSFNRQEEAMELFTYLVTKARANSNYGVNRNKANSIQFLNTTVDPKINGYVAGPFKINATYEDNLHGLAFNIKKENDVGVSNYTIKDASNNVLTFDNSILNKEFYIHFQEEVNKVTLEVSGQYYTTIADKWIADPISGKEQQPVVILKKESHNISDSKTIEKEGEFDLSLRKFITKVNNVNVATREPVVDVTPLTNKTATTAKYTHTKEPVLVETNDLVTYTIRVYNEGEVNGYANLIVDNIPNGLEFAVTNDTNLTYGWTIDANDITKVKTDYLSKEKGEAAERNNLISAFNGTSLAYKDIQIVFKVTETNYMNTVTNIAEIYDDTDSEGNEVEDIDSTPANNILTEDDIDVEHVRLPYFDLALRKFITKVENKEYERTPIPVINSQNQITYNHVKTPVLVTREDTVIYTIRVYNEGKIDGYATEIMDDIPEKLIYLPQHEINTKYGWKMYKLDSNNARQEVTNITDATFIVTDYLSKENETIDGENLIQGFDSTTMTTPKYKEVQVAFKVDKTAESKSIIINTAEIAEDANSEGNAISDVDSTPANDVDTEDDIDTEAIKIVYFDLNLKKFASKLNDTEITDREPTVDVTPLIQGTSTDAKYTLKKEPPVDVEKNDTVIFTMRIYNEGLMDGYAKEISDYIPKGLEYLPDHEINKQYKWKMYKLDTNNEREAVQQAAEANVVATSYLSKEAEENEGDNLLSAFNSENNNELDYKDIKIAFKVLAPEKANQIIINISEITDDSDADGDEVTDEDSTPNNQVETEDDQDYDQLKLKYFDLALLKYVTKVTVTENGKTTVTETGHTGLESPEPIVKVDIKRTRIKTTTVKFTYTIKVTNEGEIEGYVKEIRDYIPEGLKFVQEDNPSWAKDGETVVTKKLENTLLKPGESATVDITLTWINNENNLGEKINTAEISEDHNESDTPDIDSTPDNNKKGEDDIDTAPVLLSISTGTFTIYITLTTVILIMLSTGVVLIKKYVL